MRFRAEQFGGTNKSAAACPSDRPSFPPSPRAWPVTLGAADRPIGCALIISGRQQSLRRVILCENVVRNFAASVRSAGRATIRIHHHRSDDVGRGEETPRSGATREGRSEDLRGRLPLARPCLAPE